ncbi:putative condensin complex subunit 2/barren [Rosa chinensis]|uniref:Condensin complex subunit 2 n=1 Tax=Rosa chinensis TaxID=74649 RepID=A0A2P6S226_ROSCH|nr:condensin complex subunit 2 [Rosa chinensis]PRQ52729.1 putative condensin complex subunit 2/barren [Rosa chinensis]
MADVLSPDPTTTQKQRLSMAARLQSPTSPFFLGSNDDHLERAQTRAARAAAIRRKSLALNRQPLLDGPDSDPGLDKQQILELFQNCIKLASENKINQKNTWELNLIDHLAELVKVEEEKDAETNFQKASCTLEAGVKIYSLRVDSVHSEAYKVLGGMNRAGQDNEQDTGTEDANADNEQDMATSKKERKMSPLSTLESSFEALNVKKFDVAFAVDPLYHQTSAQFDEGGARGLLMNNLGVYGRCRVLFDSSEVPGKCISSENQHDKSDTIDLSFASEYVEEMVTNMRMKDEISPTLRHLVDRFDEDNRRPPDTYSCAQESAEQDDSTFNNDIDIDGGVASHNDGTWDYDHDEQTSMVEEEHNYENTSFPSYHEENELSSFHEPDFDDRLEKVDGFLFLSLGFTSKQNAWAGPDHWKYQKTKGSEMNPPAEPPITIKRQRSKQQPDIDFTKALEEEMSDLFAPPKNPKSLLLPANRASCSTKLPEDCHYQPEDLIKLFLLPNVKCLGRRGKKSSDQSRQQYDDCGQSSFCDDGGGQYDDGQYDEGNVHSDVEDFSTLVSQPRQVNKIEVQYDKTSKQVDVQALKETLWAHVQETVQKSTQGEEQVVSFKQILGSFPSDCRAAPTINDISPHLCFICLLHLANEHGLKILGNTNLDDLSVHLPLL